MAQNNAARGSDQDLRRNLQFTLDQAQRRTDRFMRLYHRAKDAAIKPKLFALAEQNDQLAAEIAKKIRAVLNDPS